MTNTHPFNYYLFDYDGTICNTLPTIVYSLQHAFEESGVKIPEEAAILKAVSTGINLHETLRVLHPDAAQLTTADTDVLVNAYRRLYMEHDPRLTVLFDGALTVFQQLKAAGKTVIVLSNKGVAAVEQSLQSHGLHALTDLIMAEGVMPELQLKPKPDTMMYEAVIKKQFNIKDGREVLMTGDTHADILFASNCGIRSCWAAYGYGHPAICEELKPDFTIQGISDILPLTMAF